MSRNENICAHTQKHQKWTQRASRFWIHKNMSYAGLRWNWNITFSKLCGQSDRQVCLIGEDYLVVSWISLRRYFDLVLRRGKWGEFSLVKYKMFHPFSCLMHSMYLSGRMEVEHVRRFVPDVIWLHVIHCLTGGHVLPLSLSLTGKRFLSLAADRRVNQVLALKYVCTSQIVFFYCFFFSRESPVVHPTHF